MSTAFATILESIPPWIRLAFVKTLAGLFLALATATVLISAGGTGLQDIGQDLGLRLSLYLNRVLLYDEPWYQDGPAPSFVFLDVDPEQAADSSMAGQAACAALARAGRAPPAVNLNCSPARPINRYLLAALVTELTQRRVRMIVLDIELAAEEGIISPAENKALADVLATRDKAVPLLLVRPLAGSAQSVPDGLQRVTAYAPGLFASDAARGVWNAAALPVPGQPLRRYPKCLWLTGPDSVYIPSLPYLAAQLLANSALRDPCPAAEMQQRNADPHWDNDPRIVYSLAAPEEPQDADAADFGQGPRWPETHAIYYRYLASHFWDTATPDRIGTETLRGKVVVVGASSSRRRDRHYTPLGDMSGAEVVINAIRSFSTYPANRDLTQAELLRKKTVVVGWCCLVWFAYFLVRCRLLPEAGPVRWVPAASVPAEEPAREPAPAPPHSPAGNSRTPIRSYLKVALAFVIAFLAAGGVAVAKSYNTEGPVPSLDVLIPVLALAADAYVEILAAVVHRIENVFRRWLRLPAPAAHGSEQ